MLKKQFVAGLRELEHKLLPSFDNEEHVVLFEGMMCFIVHQEIVFFKCDDDSSQLGIRVCHLIEKDQILVYLDLGQGEEGFVLDSKMIRGVGLHLGQNQGVLPYAEIELEFFSMRLWLDPHSGENVDQFYVLEKFAQQFKSLLRDQVVQSHLEMLHQSQQDRCVIDQKMTDIVSQENAENEEGILGETLEEIFESYEKWIASVSSVVESILAFEFTGSFDTDRITISRPLPSNKKFAEKFEDLKNQITQKVNGLELEISKALTAAFSSKKSSSNPDENGNLISNIARANTLNSQMIQLQCQLIKLKSIFPSTSSE